MVMYSELITLELKLYELDILQEILSSRLCEWKKALEKVESGDESLIDLIDCDSEQDAEYEIDSCGKLSGKVGLAQRRHERNVVEFIDEQQAFRVEETIELYRLIGCGFDQVLYVFKTRHGSHLIYETMEALLLAFSDGKESRLRFECSREVDHFLSYWRPSEKS